MCGDLESGTLQDSAKEDCLQCSRCVHASSSKLSKYCKLNMQWNVSSSRLVHTFHTVPPVRGYGIDIASLRFRVVDRTKELGTGVRMNHLVRLWIRSQSSDRQKFFEDRRHAIWRLSTRSFKLEGGWDHLDVRRNIWKVSCGIPDVVRRRFSHKRILLCRTGVDHQNHWECCVVHDAVLLTNGAF